MTENQRITVTSEEIEILQEVMNIAFGKATADLAEMINIFINLSVPDANVFGAQELPSAIRIEIKDYGNISLVEQKFWGKFKGSALLVFPSGSGKELISILSNEEPDTFNPEMIDELEKGTLMEVGNILIGACVGKIAELLGEVVSYSPPAVIVQSNPHSVIPENLVDPDDQAIMLRTVFNFEKKDITGYLFLLARQDSMAWLKRALEKFMEQYE